MAVKKVLEYDRVQTYQEYRIDMKVNGKKTFFKVIRMGWNVDIFEEVFLSNGDKQYYKLDLTKDSKIYKRLLSQTFSNKERANICDMLNCC